MSLAALASYLRSAPELNAPRRPRHATDLGNAVFVGSGDSLAAALLATRFGHRAHSAGDIAWTGEIPARCDTVVGVSQSGGTAATVLALRAARDAGRHTVALTTNGASPLAEVAHRTLTVPLPPVEETIPAGGYVTLAAGVLDLCGRDLDGFGHQVGTRLRSFAHAYAREPLTWPDTAPSAITVLTLPDLHSAGDFWMLKLIEATGVATRAVPLEESGHVDYFVGPQPHCTLHLTSGIGRERHDRLASALRDNGHHVVTVDTRRFFTGTDPAHSVEVALAAAGSTVAYDAAHHWGRVPFRGGAVPMDARHIKVAEPGA